MRREKIITLMIPPVPGLILLTLLHVLPNVRAGAVQIGEAVYSCQFTRAERPLIPAFALRVPSVRDRNEFMIATGEEFRLLHVNELDEMAQASAALVGDRLLIRTEQRLYSIRRKT